MKTKKAAVLLWMFRDREDYMFILAKTPPKLRRQRRPYLPGHYNAWSYNAVCKCICVAAWHRYAPPALRLKPWGGPVRLTMGLAT